MKTSLTISGVSKAFGNHLAVDHLDVMVPAGSIYGFLGPNGAGKTTTIRMLMSILYPDSGSIKLWNQLDPESCKDSLGYLPEEKGLYKKMRTTELISYFGRLKGMPRKTAYQRATALLKQFGLTDYAQMKCESLSKGMGQKVQIIATLIHDPQLIILDEPFSGLDPINVEVVRAVILQLKRAGKTIIFSTHIMEQAEQICDYILLMNRGKKIIDGALAEIKQAANQTIQLEYSGNSQILYKLPGISRINDMGHRAELSLTADANPQEILHKLVPHLSLSHFSVNYPSLHEIFVRCVGEP